MVFVLLVAALAGGVYVVSQRDDSSSEATSADEPGTPSSDVQAAIDQAEEFEKTFSVDTTVIDPDDPAAEPSASTTAPPDDLTWSAVSDPVSGLAWSMPGTDITPVDNMIGLFVGGPPGRYTTWDHFGYGFAVDVTVWDPADGGTQAHIDQMMQFDHDMHHRVNEPYGKDLTIAGHPAVAVLSKAEPDNAYVAMALVDGALVRIQITAAGTPVSPAVFERLVGSFTKG